MEHHEVGGVNSFIPENRSIVSFAVRPGVLGCGFSLELADGTQFAAADGSRREVCAVAALSEVAMISLIGSERIRSGWQVTFAAEGVTATVIVGAWWATSGTGLFASY